MTKIQKSLNSYITTEMDYWDFSGVVRVIQNNPNSQIGRAHV